MLYEVNFDELILNIGFFDVIWLEILDILGDLVPFIQFKMREKCPWRRVAFSGLQLY